MEKQKTVPCLWFDDNAEEAAKFYVSVFKKDSKILTVTHYGEASAKASGRPAGSVMTVTFMLNGQEFMGLNGGPVFKFSEAVSFMINCKDQKEIDYFWSKLAHEEGPCGWLKDKYGLSWQVVVEGFEKLAHSEKVMAALMQMKKPIIADLEKAAKSK